MSWFLEPFQYEFMQRAFLVCVLIGITNGFLGAFIVIRRLALTADALAHSLLPGLAIAAIWVGLNPAGLLVGGLVAAIIVAVGGQLITRSSRIKDETAIASLYVIAFALGVILIRFARVKVDLDSFLFGNILGVANSDIGISLGTCVITLSTLLLLQRPLLLTLFESSVARSQGIPVQALLITLMVLIVLAMLASLQAVGVLLALGLLILPAATMYLLSNSYQAMSWGGAALGVTGAVLGLILSFRLNIPSGPAIVMVLGVVFLLALLFSPKYGIVVRALRRRHLHHESLERWEPK